MIEKLVKEYCSICSKIISADMNKWLDSIELYLSHERCQDAHTLFIGGCEQHCSQLAHEG